MGCSSCLQVLAHFMTEFQAYNAALLSGSAQAEVGERLANAMKLIIIPLLTRSFQQQQRVVDDAYLTAVVKDLFDPAEEIQGVHLFGPANEIQVVQKAGDDSRVHVRADQRPLSCAFFYPCQIHLNMYFMLLMTVMTITIVLPCSQVLRPSQHGVAAAGNAADEEPA